VPVPDPVVADGAGEQVAVPEVDEDDEDLAPYVFVGTPAVMSVGKRVVH